MKALVYTSLFPNHKQPNNGVFIKHRMFEWAKLDGNSIKVVAPVPYSPSLPLLGRWYTYSQIRPHETMEGVEILHPRYPLVPKISMPFHGLSMFLSSIKTMRSLYSNYAFDIIDAHYVYPDGFAAVLLGKLFRKPVVISARGSDINQFTRFKTIKPMLRFALKNANHTISVCGALKDEIINLGIADNKTTVIPNGVDVENFKVVDRSIARDKLGLSRNSKILLSVGLLIPRKGVHVTLEGLPLVLRQHKDLDFYIIGKGPYEKELKRLIDRLHLNERVHLIGEVPNNELSTWYNAADIFCLASSREGWANVIMESLACGTPVIATNVWGAPEIITSEDIGFLADRSPKDIGEKLIEAFSRSWDRNKIRAHVEKRTWRNVADKVNGIFKYVTKNSVIA